MTLYRSFQGFTVRHDWLVKVIRNNAVSFSLRLGRAIQRRSSKPVFHHVFITTTQEAVEKALMFGAGESLELHRRALEQKISIAPGPIFSPKQRYKNSIRISCGLPWSEKIDRAVRTLGDLARESLVGGLR